MSLPCCRGLGFAKHTHICPQNQAVRSVPIVGASNGGSRGQVGPRTPYRLENDWELDPVCERRACGGARSTRLSASATKRYPYYTTCLKT